MKFAFIEVEAECAEFSVTEWCRVLRVSRAGYYAWKARPESARAREDRRLSVLVAESHFEQRRAGSVPVFKELKANGISVSRKRVIRLMQQQGLRGQQRRHFVVTTHSDGRATAPNLLARDFTAVGPNQRWVGDVTALRTPSGFLYLAAIIDLFSRAVVGWAVSAVNDTRLALAALEEATKRRGTCRGLVHHTDQGSPYTSSEYQKALTNRGIVCSLSRRGNCYDNAVAESWFGKLKVELGESFASHADAKAKLFDYIEVFFNQRRRHSSLGFISPAEFERRHQLREVA